jgi:hypothetical protein
LGISREPALISENSLHQALGDWQVDFNRILIDGGSSDGALTATLSRCCQATVLLVPYGQLEAAQLRQTTRQLTEYDAQLVGCLLADFPGNAPRRSG